jgi:proton glutamate symport protein
MKKKKTPWAVFIAIILAMALGPFMGKTGGVFGIAFYPILDLIGTLFINALTLVVVPLVSSSIITGIARIGNEADFGRMGLKTIGFYLGTTLLAILIGIIFVNLINPGLSISGSPIIPEAEAQFARLQSNAANGGTEQFTRFILQIVPSNIVMAFSHGQMLGIIFFSMLFGFALSKIESHPSSILLAFWQGIFQTMLKIAELILKLLPIGVFCLVAKGFADAGLSSIFSLFKFFVAVILGLAVFMFIALPLLLKIVAKVKPIRHFKAMAPALITAFSTSSSSATLPITIDCVEKRAGVSNRITSLVVPLGTSINMSGSALYECVAALFVAQAYGLEAPLATQFAVVLLALFTSIGVAGVPSGSLVALIVILKSLGLPAEGVGLFLAVDRLLDMARTTVNVFSDSCCAILVAATEGEEILTKDTFS